MSAVAYQYSLVQTPNICCVDYEFLNDGNFKISNHSKFTNKCADLLSSERSVTKKNVFHQWIGDVDVARLTLVSQLERLELDLS